ncbi:MAG: hypothetical protein GYB67_01655 [Chloroflexi bacterium]|nr:hypothetical protein [Chloroflexota bacterium]
MSEGRDTILNKLRAARRPFADAAPRPQAYVPVTVQDDPSPEALLERFRAELELLKGEVFVVDGDEAARAQVQALLEQHNARRVLAWDFAHVPVEGLAESIRALGVEIIQPDTHGPDRDAVLQRSKTAEVSLTGADAAAATTGTLIVSTGPGKGRLPTVLAPVHIAIIRLDQLVTRIEDWVAAQRAKGLEVPTDVANFCFITGPSRTGDIEMQLVLGVHGPGQLQVIVKR